jgi:hypothetical protein
MKSEAVGWTLEGAHASGAVRSIADYTLGLVVVLGHLVWIGLRERRHRSRQLRAAAQLD